jgi:CheY-like chemotaxis protein
VREEQINDALRAGMDDVLRKPFRIPEVFAKIEKVLGALGRRQNE